MNRRRFGAIAILSCAALCSKQLALAGNLIYDGNGYDSAGLSVQLKGAPNAAPANPLFGYDYEDAAYDFLLGPGSGIPYVATSPDPANPTAPIPPTGIYANGYGNNTSGLYVASNIVPVNSNNPFVNPWPGVILDTPAQPANLPTSQWGGGFFGVLPVSATYSPTLAGTMGMAFSVHAQVPGQNTAAIETVQWGDQFLANGNGNVLGAPLAFQGTVASNGYMAAARVTYIYDATQNTAAALVSIFADNQAGTTVKTYNQAFNTKAIYNYANGVQNGTPSFINLNTIGINANVNGNAILSPDPNIAGAQDFKYFGDPTANWLNIQNGDVIDVNNSLTIIADDIGDIDSMDIPTDPQDYGVILPDTEVDMTLTDAELPEPSPAMLMGIGVAAAVLGIRRRARRSPVS